MLFKDDSEICKRSVSEISWYPEGPQKLAVSYAIMRFQQMPDKMPTQAYIWDINNPNNFDVELRSPSPVTNICKFFFY
jgi:dynein intermediate chain 2